MANYAQHQGVKTVVIDAGHGGHDPGNLGTRRYNTREKDIALAVSLKLGKYIEENLPDVEVLYTRKTDVFVELKERANIANRAEADLFISIHCDAFTKSSVHGSTSLVLGRNHEDDNLRIARTENAVITLEENYKENYEGFDPNNPASYIIFNLYQSAYINQSVDFAQKVQNQVRERVHRRDRGVKQQPLMVTKMAAMPAVLVELGFLTNPAEEDFLNSESGQSYMASAIFRAFRDYKHEREKYDMLQPAAETNTPAEETTASAPQPTAAEEEPQEIAVDPASDTSLEQEQIKPAEEPAEADPAVYYAVQIITSIKEKDLGPKNFKGVEGVSYYKEGSLYKYVVGRSSKLSAADALKQKMKDAGFTDAFVVALANGKRISLAEAERLLQQNF